MKQSRYALSGLAILQNVKHVCDLHMKNLKSCRSLSAGMTERGRGGGEGTVNDSHSNPDLNFNPWIGFSEK